MPKLSVIVPVYNAEKYLNRCIDSILNQSFRDLELILIDDGSVDESGKICDHYAETDSRVKVIHKKNGGVSAARNDGIDCAQGEFLAFVDSDDWIDCDMYSDMISKFSDYEVDFVRCNRIYSGWPGRKDGIPDDQPERKLRDGFYNREDIINEVFYRLFVTDNLNMGPICSTILTVYKTSFLNRNGIRYQAGVKINEDLLFSSKVVYSADSFYYTEKAYYHWFYNQNSVSRSFHKDMFESLKKTFYALKEFFTDVQDYDFSEQLQRYALFAVLTALNQKDSILSFKEKYKYCKSIINDEIINNFSIQTIKNLSISRGYRLEIMLIKHNLSFLYTVL